MILNKPFNRFSYQEYLDVIPNHKQFSDFNTLGLYRSLLENKQLNLEEKLEIRELSNTYFQKSFDFLQVKDPFTYLNVYHLGTELTRQQERDFWDTILKNQKKILNSKRIRHRNFGIYSKHDCGYDYCPYNGLMIKQGSTLAENVMCVDNRQKEKKQKALRNSKEQRAWKRNNRL